MAKRSVEKLLDNVFKNNFYATSEYADFLSRVLSLLSRKEKISEKTVHLIKKKSIAIDSYNISIKRALRKRKISYMSVLPQINDLNTHPSYVEYPIIFKGDYLQCYDKFHRTFKKKIRRAEKFKFKIEIVTGFNQKIVDDVYSLYKKCARRLGSIILPQLFFEEYLKTKNSLLFLIIDKEKIRGFSFCFENADNLYFSVGYTDKSYWNKYISYKLYNERIKYACERGLNIHLGMGEHGSGYCQIKKEAGAIFFKCERYPHDEGVLKILLFFSKLKIFWPWIWLISKIMPRKMIYQMIPFT